MLLMHYRTEVEIIMQVNIDSKNISLLFQEKAFTPESTIARVVLNVGETLGHYVLFDSITVKKENNVSDKTTRAGGSEIECLKAIILSHLQVVEQMRDHMH